MEGRPLLLADQHARQSQSGGGSFACACFDPECKWLSWTLVTVGKGPAGPWKLPDRTSNGGSSLIFEKQP
eukprot:29191-Eustigmatos_ZCMA.PRE.1